MRARNLKPGFFKNEDLAELDPLVRILFAGLWGMADREGRLEDRPKRIKAEVLPYDSINVDKALDKLAQSPGRFIVRYTVGNQCYIAIPGFKEHQSPHVKEGASTIPAPDEHQTSPVQTPEEPGLARARSDSGLRTPDSGLLNADCSNAGQPAATPLVDNELLDELLYTASTIQSKVAEWKPTKADRETMLALTQRFPANQLRRELLKFKAYAPQRDYKSFGRTFASWMGREQPEPMQQGTTQDARETRITQAVAQWVASGDEDIARCLCYVDEWPEVERRYREQRPADDFAGIDFGEEPPEAVAV